MAGTISRRRFAGATLGFGAALGLTRSGLAQSATAVASPAGGAWSFTDDRGRTVSLGERPTTIIAQTSSAATLWDFGVRPAGFFGPNVPASGSTFPETGSMDVSQVRWLGDYGEMDLEAAVALDAQLYVDVVRVGENLWYLTAEEESRLAEICPAVGIAAARVSVLQTVETFEKLVGLLGADLSSETQVTAKADFKHAEQAFRDAVAAKPGVRVMLLAGTADSAFVVNPEVVGDGIYYRDLGLDIVVPEHPTASTGDNFEELSWEEIGRYPADVILYDSRNNVADLDDNAVWKSLPAVKAGQVGSWYGTFPWSYQQVKRVLDLMTETISASKVILGL